MKYLVAISVAALASAAFAAPPPAADQSAVSEFACQLGGDCGSPDSAAPSAEAAPAAAPRGARSASVRGFTFKKVAPAGSPEAMSAPPPTAMASASTRPMAPKQQPMAAKGVANLRLDFASGSSDLNDPDRQRLGALSSALASARLTGRRLRIEGHTDSKGSSARNLDLSRRRAQSVADYLVSTGVSRDRIDVVGYGSTQPLPGRSSADGANRRVMAVMLN